MGIKRFDPGLSDDINLDNVGDKTMSIRYYYTVTATIEMIVCGETVEDIRESTVEILSRILEGDDKFIIHGINYNQEKSDKENE